jgi:putative transposase
MENPRCIDDIFIKRLLRPMKYECVSLHGWENGSRANAGVSRLTTI